MRERGAIMNPDTSIPTKAEMSDRKNMLAAIIADQMATVTPNSRSKNMTEKERKKTPQRTK